MQEGGLGGQGFQEARLGWWDLEKWSKKCCAQQPLSVGTLPVCFIAALFTAASYGPTLASQNRGMNNENMLCIHTGGVLQP